jgi:5-guanidino-2-oxopentanoate decarboxylase
MGNQQTCGEALVRLLERYGADTVFGIPGVHTLDLYRGFANSKVRHVQTRHEQGAVFMADGYARASGKPGVCFLITGPGVTNGATGLGQAFADSIPVLMISSDTASYSRGKGWGCLHEITDQRDHRPAGGHRTAHGVQRDGAVAGRGAATDWAGLFGL